ncbi:FAD dependent oxidoreductase [Sporobacter termitidis DSM 10068]|uniref:FAD dependent oxidoreductase n=1 Tax=Sporobacter termitidis DSM 10068 TaxID=1123282 RepID=A0A1M5UCI3_9FIRM|nr:FAD-dependent oxidoreductase [Sporobacter termitidis]SHH60611.1 FAD dependent oxidoreductase [Sporobacter termitidis DSM 10068]
MTKTISEPAREVPVYDECDILVVGAGPAGVTAAVATAKNKGGKIILMERYATLGGMATGGQVLAIPFLSDGPELLVSGIMDEWVSRLRAKPDAVFGPELSELGSTDEKVLIKYRHHGLFGLDRIRYGVNVDPEMLKIVLNDLVRDYGIRVCCGCWGAQAVTEDGAVAGVIFESKEGRKAILARVVIDCTGDGDIFASAGAEFEFSTFSTARTGNTALVFRVAGADYDVYAGALREIVSNPHAQGGAFKDLQEKLGFQMYPFSGHRRDVMWINNWIPRSCMTIEGLTGTAFTMTNSIETIIDHLRNNFPGMENAYLYDIASQIGTRGSRRLKGVSRLTMDNIARRTGRDDLVAVIPTLGGTEEYPRIEMPYGVLVPEKADGLLAAGRCFSSEETANEAASWIPHCVALGEVAGTAAARALDENVQPRGVNVKKLRQTLKSQGVYLYD